MRVTEPGNDRTVARILIIDDHPLVRRGLADLIGEVPGLSVCGEASSAAEAIRLTMQAGPDLALVDLSLEEGCGLDVIRRIRSQMEQTKILVCSMRDEQVWAERALREGASGFVHKTEATTTVIEAIHSVLAGRIHLSPNVSNRLLASLTRSGSTPERSPLESLSNRELEVLDLLGQGLSTRQIAEQLHISVKTVETHRDHLRTKLHITTSAELTRFALLQRMENG